MLHHFCIPLKIKGKQFYDSYLSCFNNKVFFYFLLLNLISNCSYFYTDRTSIPLLIMICLSVTISMIEVVLFRALVRFKRLSKAYLVLMSGGHIFLILCDYFCLFYFQTTLTQEKIDIIRETNPVETLEFLHTYLSFGLIISIIFGIVILVLLLIRLAAILSYFRKLSIVFSILSLCGVAVWTFMAFSYILFRDGFAIPQYTSITRILYSYKVSKGREGDIVKLCAVCKKVKGSSTFDDKPNVIVLIGESSSVYHSELFGYDHHTTPKLKQIENQGSLIAFDDVVSADDHTHGAMQSIFSLDSMGTAFCSTPLFPAVYKNSMYKVHCYDNQYFVGGNNFLSSPELSKIMFTDRNETNFRYDEELIKSIKIVDNASLYVVHLLGQHYTYSTKYPNSWNKFKAKDYDANRWNEHQRELIAQYDNATLYNDFVISSLIQKFKDTNTILIHFSDHGEEVFEVRDYNGHGNAPLSPNLKYQIRVPLFIWMSDRYKKLHKDIYEKALASKHVPIITDNISHTILGVGGISTKWYKSSRDFLSNNYNAKKHRIVLHTIDYDAYKPTEIKE
ncbi:metal-dependent hydrolase [Prevotella bivia DNF00320]|uniref:Metal-dependent hydrolase n=2 Tax=Prevotella bivia TaxID=28125 RepID=A0A096CL21_9BACT|nr:metal-dependent hydrolase [Prevotella bivia DNF00320]